MRGWVESCTKAWESTDADLAKRRLESLASSLEIEHRGARGLGARRTRRDADAPATRNPRKLYRTLRSTNTIENLNGSIVTYTRNVKRWQEGSMIVRWASAAVLDASARFRRIRGFRELDRLIGALETIESNQNNATDQQVA